MRLQVLLEVAEVARPQQLPPLLPSPVTGNARCEHACRSGRFACCLFAEMVTSAIVCRCGNVNWERRETCNMCQTPKPGKKLESRTGRGGGFNERQEDSMVCIFLLLLRLRVCTLRCTRPVLDVVFHTILTLYRTLRLDGDAGVNWTAGMSMRVQGHQAVRLAMATPHPAWVVPQEWEAHQACRLLPMVLPSLEIGSLRGTIAVGTGREREIGIVVHGQDPGAEETEVATSAVLV